MSKLGGNVAEEDYPRELPALLTIDEAASLLRVSRTTLYRAAQNGEMPGFKVRGQWRILRTDVEGLLGMPIDKAGYWDKKKQS